MKYKLLKEFPGYPIGYIFESSTFPQFDVFNIKAYPDFFEEVKEPKTIYNLGQGDAYFCIEGVVRKRYLETSFCNYAHTLSFLTEREAKRNKLLRELATRIDKWLPEEDSEYTTIGKIGFDIWNWVGDNYDFFHYHSGLVFRNEEEYSRWLTEDAKDLLFNI